MLKTVRRIITENVLLLSRRYRLAAGHGGAGEIRRCTYASAGWGTGTFRARTVDTRVTVPLLDARRSLLQLWLPDADGYDVRCWCRSSSPECWSPFTCVRVCVCARTPLHRSCGARSKRFSGAEPAFETFACAAERMLLVDTEDGRRTWYRRAKKFRGFVAGATVIANQWKRLEHTIYRLSPQRTVCAMTGYAAVKTTERKQSVRTAQAVNCRSQRDYNMLVAGRPLSNGIRLSFRWRMLSNHFGPTMMGFRVFFLKTIYFHVN